MRMHVAPGDNFASATRWDGQVVQIAPAHELWLYRGNPSRVPAPGTTPTDPEVARVACVNKEHTYRHDDLPGDAQAM